MILAVTNDIIMKLKQKATKILFIATTLLKHTIKKKANPRTHNTHYKYAYTTTPTNKTRTQYEK